MIRALAASALIATACLAALSASAQATKQVEGLTVVPGPGPTVQSTYPADGSSVPAGVVILKIVFDQPMTPDAWAYGPSPDGDFPHCLADPRLLADQRTYALLCTVPQQNHTYAVEINDAPRFASAAGRSAKTYTLKFSTTDDVTRGLDDALTQAGLAATDDPIMTWRDPGKGVSQTPPPP
ncbi:MAG TPA: hypothetical protein VHW60_09260 [Caulobacteraceae bacterium]|jgi:hypothetical protein|nr:hypothetical protein [Caulobacteraceae bacterium]